MTKMRPKNIVYMIVCVFAPWRFFNTFIVLEADRILFSRYYAKSSRVMKKDKKEISIDDILEIGFPSDLKIHSIEKSIRGSKGVYVSQEIDFKTKSGYVAFNARPYSRKQLQFLIHYLTDKNEVITIGKRLTNLL